MRHDETSASAPRTLQIRRFLAASVTPCFAGLAQHAPDSGSCRSRARSGLSRRHLAGALFCAPSGPAGCHGLADRQGHELPAPWGKGDARRNQQAAFRRSGFRRRAVRSRRRPACSGCQGSASSPSRPRRPGLPVLCRHAAPPVSRHRRGARGQARWGHRRSAGREWLVETALPAMASARSAGRAKAVPTAHWAVGTAFQNLTSAGSQVPCLRPPSGRQSSCTRRKCCRSGAYAPGCSGPWRAREPCAWPRGKSAW